jgi:uncharacterized protein with NRDE domain
MNWVFPQWPLVIAANRDERETRSSRSWHDWGNGIFAPQDLVRGGTWIGVNKNNGRVAAITNRDDFPHKGGMKSRGKLLVDFLEIDNPFDMFEHEFSDMYNGFHMVFGTPKKMFLVANHGTHFVFKRLPLGLSVITAYGYEPRHCTRANIIENRFIEIDTAPYIPERHEQEFDRLLNFHADGNPTSACCVHDPNETHKTISSSLIFHKKDSFEIWQRNGFACSKDFSTRHNVEICQG